MHTIQEIEARLSAIAAELESASAEQITALNEEVDSLIAEREALITMLDNDCKTAIHLSTPCYFAFIDSSCLCTSHGLKVDSFIVYGYMFMDRMLVFTKMTTDVSLFYRPW